MTALFLTMSTSTTLAELARDKRAFRFIETKWQMANVSLC